MKKVLVSVLGIAAFGFASMAFAAKHAKDPMAGMVGKWSWEKFTIDCTKGGANGVSCKVTAGPKNVGMEMIQSKLAMDPGGFFTGKVAHPMTAETYNSKITPQGADAFKMDGCTAGGACASGVFTRVK